MPIKNLQKENSHNSPSTKGKEYTYTFLHTTSVNVCSVTSKTSSSSFF